MKKIYLCLLLLFTGCKSQTENQIPSDQCEIVSCIDCEGTGIFIYKFDDPLVELDMVPEGMTEDCQTCKSKGKLKKCTVANGMVYYMSF